MEESRKLHHVDDIDKRLVRYYRNLLNSIPATKDQRHKAFRMKKAGSLALVLVFTMSGISVALFLVPGTIGYARAASGATYWGWQGYLGNDTIYLTTNDNGFSYVNNEVSMSQSNATAPDNVGNALFLTDGIANVGSSYYSYNPNSNGGQLEITFYLAAVGGTYQRTVYVGPSLQTYGTFATQTQVSVSNIPDTNSLAIGYSNTYAKGINESSGSGGTQQATEEALVTNVAGQLPIVGYFVGTQQTELALYGAISPPSSVNPAYGTNAAYESYFVDNGSGQHGVWQNVFAAGLNVTVYISQTLFRDNPVIHLMADNLISEYGEYPLPEGYQGSAVYLNYTTTWNTEAIPIEVYYGGSPVAGAWVKLVDQTATSPYYGDVYHVKTNSLGQVVFYGYPNDTYDITTSANTPWGSMTIIPSQGSPLILGNGATSSAFVQTLLYGKVYGTVSSNDGVSGASVIITAPNGSQGTVGVDSSGDYSFLAGVAGVYSMYASFYQYSGGELCKGTSSTVKVNVSLENSEHQDFYIKVSCSACVLYGTEISTVNGTLIQVQYLTTGMGILSYDITQHALFNGTVVSVTSKQVSQVWDIDGILKAAGPNDQPLYVQLQNGTAEWLMLGRINTSMKVFDPLNNTWIPVYNITVLNGNFTVYDISAAPVYHTSNTRGGDYIANGLLVDDKPI